MKQVRRITLARSGVTLTSKVEGPLNHLPSESLLLCCMSRRSPYVNSQQHAVVDHFRDPVYCAALSSLPV